MQKRKYFVRQVDVMETSDNLATDWFQESPSNTIKNSFLMSKMPETARKYLSIIANQYGIQ